MAASPPKLRAQIQFRQLRRLAPCELDFSVDFGVVSLEKMELGMRFKGTSVLEIFSDKLGTCLSTVWLF